MAAAFMTELPTVRFVRKLFLGLVGEGELLVLFELHAGLVECYTAICGCAVLEKHHEDEEVDRVIHRLRDARREPLHRDTLGGARVNWHSCVSQWNLPKLSRCQRVRRQVTPPPPPSVKVMLHPFAPGKCTMMGRVLGAASAALRCTHTTTTRTHTPVQQLHKLLFDAKTDHNEARARQIASHIQHTFFNALQSHELQLLPCGLALPLSSERLLTLLSESSINDAVIKTTSESDNGPWSTSRLYGLYSFDGNELYEVSNKDEFGPIPDYDTCTCIVCTCGEKYGMDMHLDNGFGWCLLRPTTELVFVDYTSKDPAQDALCGTAWLTDQASAHEVLESLPKSKGEYAVQVNPANPHEAVHEQWKGNQQGEKWLHSSERWGVGYMPKASIILANLSDDMVHSAPTGSALNGVEDRVFLRVPVADDTLRYMCAWARCQRHDAQSNAQRAELERLYGITLLSRLVDKLRGNANLPGDKLDDMDKALDDLKAFKEKCGYHKSAPPEDE